MAELYVFMTVGSILGVLSTILLCFITAVLGGFLVRLQGLSTLMKAQDSLRTGKMPLNEIFNGFCIVIAGALLITPGFVTDIVGFLLLIPIFRVFLQQFLSKNASFRVNTGAHKRNTPNKDGEDVIEGHYERVDKATSTLDQPSKDD